MNMRSNTIFCHAEIFRQINSNCSLKMLKTLPILNIIDNFRFFFARLRAKFAKANLEFVRNWFPPRIIP